jgi:hypothetical protein
MLKYCAAFVLTLFWILAPLLSPTAQAAIGGPEEKNLRGRLGIGFTNQITTTAAGNSIPALSAKYYIGRSFATSLQIGFDTRSGPTTGGSTMVLGGKLFRNMFTESNLIFYIGAGLAYINHSGTNLQGSLFFGSEFFLTQIPSLGLSVEAGVRGDSTSGSFAIRTTGDSFLSGGMHFYF